MSIKAINWTYQSVKVGRHMKATLLALADIADDEGYAYPSMGTIAAKAEVDRRTVIRHLKKLETFGVLEITKRQGGYNKITNVYRLCLEKSIDCRPLLDEINGDTMSPMEEGNSDSLSPINGDNVSPMKAINGDTGVTAMVTDSVTSLVTDSVTQTISNHNTNTTTTTGDLFSRPHVTNPPHRTPLTDDWQPSDHVFDKLRLRGIPTEFGKGLIDAFRFYWQGDVAKPGQWESRFLNHAVHRWEKGGKAQFLAATAQGVGVVDRLRDTSWAPEGMLQ